MSWVGAMRVCIGGFTVVYIGGDVVIEDTNHDDCFRAALQQFSGSRFLRPNRLGASRSLGVSASKNGGSLVILVTQYSWDPPGCRVLAVGEFCHRWQGSGGSVFCE